MDDRKSIQAHRTVQIPSYGYFYIYVYLVNFCMRHLPSHLYFSTSCVRHTCSIVPPHLISILYISRQVHLLHLPSHLYFSTSCVRQTCSIVPPHLISILYISRTGSCAASSLTSLLPQILRPSHLQYGSASTGFFHLLMYVVFQLYYYGRKRKLNFRIPALGLE